MLVNGIIPPVATPLLNDNEIDEQGLERLVNHLLAGGVHGLFLLGTTGEGTSLSYDLRKSFIKKACRLVNKKVPVLAGITDTVFENSVRMAYEYKEAGADMLVVAPPFYNPLSQAEMQHYLDDLAPRLPLPFLLYNIPSHTKINLTLETVIHARDVGASGIKDSSGDVNHILALIETFKNSDDFAVLTGTEAHISRAIQNGGQGAVPGSANIFPGLYVDFYYAIKNKDFDKINSIQNIILQINKKLYRFGDYPSGIILGIKSALKVLDICNDYAAHPLRQYDEEVYGEIRKLILELDATIKNNC